MNTLCPLPFVHLATHPEGKVSLCCISDHTNNMSAAKNFPKQVLNLNKDRIINVVNSDYFKQVRTQMIHGEKPLACSRCYKEEELLGNSKRLQELQRFSFEPTVDIHPNFKFIELRLGNICNVKCRTCNPYSSSQWKTEYNKLQKDLPFVTDYSNILDCSWTESDQFWNELLDYSADVELIYINGGEPTLVEKHWAYLEKLIERGLHKKVKLWYSINMTNIPDKLLHVWSHFKEVEIHASIDDLSNRNEYIRKGTQWSTVELNLQKLLSIPWITLSVTQTVSWINVYHTKEFREYFNNLNITVNTNIVYDPKFYSISILPFELKEKLIGIIPDDILNYVSTAPDRELLQNGISFNKWLDNNRTEDFCRTFGTWGEIMYDRN